MSLSPTGPLGVLSGLPLLVFLSLVRHCHPTASIFIGSPGCCMSRQKEHIPPEILVPWLCPSSSRNCSYWPCHYLAFHRSDNYMAGGAHHRSNPALTNQSVRKRQDTYPITYGRQDPFYVGTDCPIPHRPTYFTLHFLILKFFHQRF